MSEEEKIKISVNEEDIQNLINCYEKDIEYIKQLEKQNKELKEKLKNANDTLDTHNELIKYLQERINKAIEYIKNENLRIVDITKDIPELCDIELLKILKGE